ncbi:hypothetical protein N0V88_007242 [Collariella sp. IMI 366227]|nr:hypothetical protein N0V88_007242 [Collariella sp. IMI 366227]
MQVFGRVDILINVVGTIGAHGTAIDVSLEGWRQGMEVNVTSMMLMAKYAIPAMLKNDLSEGPVRGSVVNVGSVAGLRGGTLHLMYPTRMLYTPMMYRDGMSEEMRERRRKRSLLGTEGNAWDCAHAIRFLAGDEARWITGTVLAVDAGATAAVMLDAAA